MTSTNSQNSNQNTMGTKNQNGDQNNPEHYNGTHPMSDENMEDDGGGEFVMIEKKHNRGNKTRMRGRGGGSGGGGGSHNHNNRHNYGNRIPLTHYPFHPSNIRRQQLLQQQQENNNNNAASSSNDGSSSMTGNDNSSASCTQNDKPSSIGSSVPSSSSGTSTLSTASGPASNSDASSSTTGDVTNVNELQPELDEISKPKYVEAPPPAINPWKVYNAAAVLGKKAPSATTNGVNNVASNKPFCNTNGLSNTTAPVGPRISNTAPKSSAINTVTALPANTKGPSQNSATTNITPAPAQNNANYSPSASSPPPTASASNMASSSAQTTAPAPAPWVSGRVLKLRQSLPNYAEKLKTTDWPSLSEVVEKIDSTSLTDEPKIHVTDEGNKVGKTTASTQTQTELEPSPPSSTQTQTEKEKLPFKNERSDTEFRGRGRGRGRGGTTRGHLGRGNGRPNSASGYFKEHNGYHANGGTDRQEYTDYPHDFTTIVPTFPTNVSEFIMPYTTSTASTPAMRVTPIIRPDASEMSFFVSSIVDRAGLVNMVRLQIEYYFSTENLDKDFFLRRKMDAEGYLPVKLIASFQRVQNMTTDYSVVVEAIQSSLELDFRQLTSSVRTKNDPWKWPIADGAQFYSRPIDLAASAVGVPSLLPTPTFD